MFYLFNVFKSNFFSFSLFLLHALPNFTAVVTSESDDHSFHSTEIIDPVTAEPTPHPTNSPNSPGEPQAKAPSSSQVLNSYDFVRNTVSLLSPLYRPLTLLSSVLRSKTFFTCAQKSHPQNFVLNFTVSPNHSILVTLPHEQWLNFPPWGYLSGLVIHASTIQFLLFFFFFNLFRNSFCIIAIVTIALIFLYIS